MAINVSTLVPASEKAKNVATETYVDSAVAAVDVSGDIADNNELFAQKLGSSVSTPLIDGIVANRNKYTKDELVLKIIAKADAYAAAIGQLVGARQDVEDNI